MSIFTEGLDAPNRHTAMVEKRLAGIAALNVRLEIAEHANRKTCDIGEFCDGERLIRDIRKEKKIYLSIFQRTIRAIAVKAAAMDGNLWDGELFNAVYNEAERAGALDFLFGKMKGSFASLLAYDISNETGIGRVHLVFSQGSVIAAEGNQVFATQGAEETDIRPLEFISDQNQVVGSIRAAAGNEQYELGEYGLADRLFQSALEKDPDNPEIFHGAGCALERLGKPDKAIWFHKKAVELAKDSSIRAYYYLDLAHARFDTGDNAKMHMAKDDCDCAIAGNPDAAAYVLRAMIIRRLGMGLDKALGDCNSAIEKSPGYAAAYEERAMVLETMGRYEEAAHDRMKCNEIAKAGENRNP